MEFAVIECNPMVFPNEFRSWCKQNLYRYFETTPSYVVVSIFHDGQYHYIEYEEITKDCIDV